VDRAQRSELAPQQVRDAAVHSEGRARWLRRIPRFVSGASVAETPSVRAMITNSGLPEVVGGGPHHLQLAHKLVGGDERLARDGRSAASPGLR
jgi:hypothetical protein